MPEHPMMPTHRSQLGILIHNVFFLIFLGVVDSRLFILPIQMGLVDTPLFPFFVCQLVQLLSRFERLENYELIIRSH